MDSRLRWLLINVVVVLGGGALLSSLNLLPWFAIGVPVLISLGITEFTRRVKTPTYSERQATRHAATEAASH